MKKHAKFAVPSQIGDNTDFRICRIRIFNNNIPLKTMMFQRLRNNPLLIIPTILHSEDIKLLHKCLI